MQKTTTKLLAEYFNEGDGKRALKDFTAELKELTDGQKLHLAVLAAGARNLGETVTVPASLAEKFGDLKVVDPTTVTPEQLLAFNAA